MQHRFRFLASYDSGSRQWRIEADEFFHAKKVLRLGTGAEVEVFDGKGSWAEGLLGEMGKDYAIADCAALNKEERSKMSLSVALGALQQQTMADLVPCLVELGVDKVHVFMQEGLAKARLNEKLLERWHKIAIAAAKQSKRAWLPTFSSSPSLEELVPALVQNHDGLWVLDPEAKQNLLNADLSHKRASCLLLGSEKGLSASDLELTYEAGFEAASLGPGILRSFTAALAGAALMSAKRVYL